jgi:hypothetical protein
VENPTGSNFRASLQPREDEQVYISVYLALINLFDTVFIRHLGVTGKELNGKTVCGHSLMGGITLVV